MRRGVLERAEIDFDPGPFRVANARARSGTLRLRGEGTTEVDLRVDRPALEGAAAEAEVARARLAGDPIDFAKLRGPKFAALDLDGGGITDARRLGARLFHNRRVAGGSGSFSAHLEGPPDRLGGQARVALSRLRVRARGVIVRGDARIRARIARLDPRHGADLTGTRIAVDGGRLVPDEEISPGWWGRAVLTRARLRFDSARLDADLQARCRDARPIVGLYAHLSDLPGFLNSLFAMDGLVVHGSAQAGRGWVRLPEVRAEGNDASIRATLSKEGADQRGAAILTAHGISVALDLDGGGSSLHLFGPGDFFAERQREIRARPMGRRAPRRPR